MSDPNMDDLKEQYFDQGYFIVDDAVEPQMLDELEPAAAGIVDTVRSGQIDVSGQGPQATGILGLISPAFDEPVFGRYLCSPPVLRYVEAFLGRELRMGHVHLWCCEKSYDTGWHRDIGAYVDRTVEEEMAIMDAPMASIKWQLALLDDPCLWIVPGSHNRYRTDEERRVLKEDKKADLPGQAQVVLKRGQTLFWNGKICHRGRKPADLDRRLSVTGGLKKYDPDDEMDYVGKDWEWRLDDGIRERLPEKLQLYYDRWRALTPAIA